MLSNLDFQQRFLLFESNKLYFNNSSSAQSCALLCLLCFWFHVPRVVKPRP